MNRIEYISNIICNSISSIVNIFRTYTFYILCNYKYIRMLFNAHDHHFFYLPDIPSYRIAYTSPTFNYYETSLALGHDIIWFSGDGPLYS